MSRDCFKLNLNGGYEIDNGNCPDWLARFAEDYAEKEAKTAVEVARDRDNGSIRDQLHYIMNGTSSPYSSVEEAVQDYHKRTGLEQYRNKAVAEEILAMASLKEDEDEKKNFKPKLIEKNPNIATYIRNVIETNNNIQLPAVLFGIGETFSRHGVSESDLGDYDLAKYISDLLSAKQYKNDNYDNNLGKGVGIYNEDVGRADDPFTCLMPARNL